MEEPELVVVMTGWVCLDSPPQAAVKISNIAAQGADLTRLHDLPRAFTGFSLW